MSISSAPQHLLFQPLLLPSSSAISGIPSYAGVRWIRTRGNGHKDNEHEESGRHSHESNATDEAPKDEQPEKPKVDPALLRKLRIYVLIVGGLSFVMSFIALSQYAAGKGASEGIQPEHLTKQGIDFKTFLSKFLRAGEVKRIIFCPDYSRAVAFLHAGAVVDGKKVHDPVVVVAYAHGAQQFWADVRKEEDDMGISISDGVPIDMYNGMTTFRLIELMVGVLIIVWLSTQYGRLLRNRLLAMKQKKSSGNGSGGDPK